MKPEVSDKIRGMALDFVSQRSVVDTPDEVKMAEKVYTTIAGLDYYKKHPELVYYIPCEGDLLGRKIVVAEMRGEKAPSDKTVVLIGHVDTVGISDYGPNKDLATKPAELIKALSKLKLSKEVTEDLESGKYMFGRGLFDMKSGDAIIICVMDEISKDIKNFEGNLVYAAVIDEEGNSAGMLNFVPHLIKLKEQKHYDYLAMIDTDYMAPAYPGDPLKYIYVGTVGKTMPTFYIVGKETHVGESFDGLDPNQIAAALTERINLNPEFSDTVDGEVTLPPVTLKQRDLKTEYSVQIANKAVLMFNYATHDSTPDQVLNKMVDTAQECFRHVVDTLNERYAMYCKMVGRKFRRLPWAARTITYEELFDAVKKEVPDLDEKVDAYIEELKNDSSIDVRDKSLKIVDYVHDLWSDKDPVVVVYLTPPYYPHIHVDESDPRGKALIDAVNGAIETVKADPAFDYTLLEKEFLPCISDLSYGAAPKEPDVLEKLEKNMPGYGVGKIYSLPLKDMQALDLPVVDIGTVGKDAHKFTERIDTHFTFEYTPELVYQTIMNLLK
ncbi:MAG: M20/M25/M40 family metallo-hydrolase [Eubacterium sp.]|jgi:arginine utilization protein RocB